MAGAADNGKTLARDEIVALDRVIVPLFSMAWLGIWIAFCEPVISGPLEAHLERYMDMLSARQKLVASNIANVDTPGYLTRDIDFTAELQNAGGGTPHAQTVEGLAVRNDGNNVSIDRETRLLSENALRFQVASSLMHSQIQTLRSAIKEGQST